MNRKGQYINIIYGLHQKVHPFNLLAVNETSMHQVYLSINITLEAGDSQAVIWMNLIFKQS